MKAANANCPSQSLLSDFGLGKLDAASAEMVAQHLETCSVCRQWVADLPGDSFVDRLRGAHRSLMDVPAADLGPALMPTEAWSRDARPPERHGELGWSPHDVVPPELANLDDYEILGKLGHGGMGVVYLARNRPLSRVEVLKAVNPALLDRPGALDRFQQEIRSAAMLRHANIVAAYSAFRAADLLIFAMEYVSGQDLLQVVKQRGRLPAADAADYIHQAALGLEHAHEKQLVHRDIKPNNLMLALDGTKHVVKILDLGLAKAASENVAETALTHTGQILGTPEYIAPEQIVDARQADIRADIYSLGCTLYFLLSGRPPFQETSVYAILEAHRKREPTALSRLRPDVPPGLAAVAAKMMAKDPANRYQTPTAVAQALLPFFQPDEMPATTAAPADLAPLGDIAAAGPIGNTDRKRRYLVRLAALLLVVALLAIGSAVCFTTLGGGAVESRLKQARPASAGAAPDPRQPNAPKRFVCEIPAGLDECWSIDGGELVQSSLKPGACMFFGDPSWTDYDLSFDFKLLDGWGLRTHFRYRDGANNYSLVIGAFNNTVHSVESISDGKFGYLAQGQFKQNKGEWYHVEIKVRGQKGDCLLDGHNIFRSFEVDRQGRGRVGWLMENGASFRFRSILVKDPSGTILLDGLPELQQGRSAPDDAAPQIAETAPEPDQLEPARAPFSVEEAKQYQDRCARALNTGAMLKNLIGMSLTLIPPGEFMMGTSQPDIDGLVASVTNKGWQDEFRSEYPPHRVSLANPFYIGTYEVTQQEYAEVMDRNPSSLAPGAAGAQDRVRGRDTSQHPVEKTSWFDAIEFCNRLSNRESLEPYYSRQGDHVAVLGGEGYRLPTEAEWEYACRAGTTTPWPCGFEATSAWKHGWLFPAGGTQRVGTKSANAFGLHDLLGNVWEWCWDGHGAYGAADVSDPTGPDNAPMRVLRGGSYKIGVAYARSAKRWYALPSSTWDDAGFRVARNCP